MIARTYYIVRWNMIVKKVPFPEYKAQSKNPQVVQRCTRRKPWKGQKGFYSRLRGSFYIIGKNVQHGI